MSDRAQKSSGQKPAPPKAIPVKPIDRVPPAPDKITFTLYDAASGQDREFICDQIKKLCTISTKLALEASKMERHPPKVDVLLNFIPAPGVVLSAYPDAHKKFFSYFNSKMIECKEHLSKNSNEYVDFDHEVKDIYELLPAAEKLFFSRLKGCGSVADIPKVFAIINNASGKHLQLDATTKISNYSEFYRQTFASETDAFYIMSYATFGISVQNKVVYTVPKSKFVKSLHTRMTEFNQINNPKNNTISGSRPYPTITCNVVYQEVFAKALEICGFATRCTRSGAYIANLNPDHIVFFRLTPCIIPAICKTWSNEPPIFSSKEKESMSLPITIKGIKYDCESLCYLINLLIGSVAYQTPETLIKLHTIAKTTPVQCLEILQEYFSINKAKASPLFKIISNNYLGLALKKELFMAAGVDVTELVVVPSYIDSFNRCAHQEYKELLGRASAVTEIVSMLEMRLSSTELTAAISVVEALPPEPRPIIQETQPTALLFSDSQLSDPIKTWVKPDTYRHDPYKFKY